MVEFRAFSGRFGMSDDYEKLHRFLVKSKNEFFTYGRLDWHIITVLLQHKSEETFFGFAQAEVR